MTSNSDSSLFTKLPDDICLSILARISTLWYPTVSLVSKKFRSLIISEQLDMERTRLGTRQECVYVCLQDSIETCDRRWFSLWKKPYDHLPLTHCKVEVKCTENWLLPMSSSYSRRFTTLHETVGTETYEIGGQNTSSSTNVWVYDNKLNDKRRKAPNMLVARKNALTCSMDGKVYVMGGCEADESTHWGEVFDPKTQTWKPLQDPGVELRNSLAESLYLQANEGKVYVIRSDKNNFVYHTKEDVWEVSEDSLADSVCEIDNIKYCYSCGKCWWFDTKNQYWSAIKGLSWLYRNPKLDTAIGNYGGKLVLFWGRTLYPLAATKKIWCAVIVLAKGHDGNVWGNVEWLDVVLIVPRSYSLLHCINSWQ